MSLRVVRAALQAPAIPPAGSPARVAEDGVAGAAHLVAHGDARRRHPAPRAVRKGRCVDSRQGGRLTARPAGPARATPPALGALLPVLPLRHGAHPSVGHLLSLQAPRPGAHVEGGQQEAGVPASAMHLGLCACRICRCAWLPCSAGTCAWHTGCGRPSCPARGWPPSPRGGSCSPGGGTKPAAPWDWRRAPPAAHARRSRLPWRTQAARRAPGHLLQLGLQVHGGRQRSELRRNEGRRAPRHRAGDGVLVPGDLCPNEGLQAGHVQVVAAVQPGRSAQALEADGAVARGPRDLEALPVPRGAHLPAQGRPS